MQHKLMQSRKQADQLSKGDCVGLSLSMYFEVLTSDVQDGQVVLEVSPASCGKDNCPIGCDCHLSLFDGHDGPFKLRVDAKKRLEFGGNLEQDEAQIKVLVARVKRRRASKNGSFTGDAVPAAAVRPTG